MGSVGCDGEDEFQPSTSISRKYRSPGKFLDDCGPVPRKQRSATKKRGHESITPPLPISRKLNQVSNGVDLRRKDGSKKSKLKMKQEQVTKDEEEVAETLYALASMVPETTKNKKLGLDVETSETKSTPLQQEKVSEPACKDSSISTPQETTEKVSTQFTIETSHCSSNLTESTVQVFQFHSSGDAKQLNLPIGKQFSFTGTSGVQLESSLVPMPTMPTLGATPSGEFPIMLEQVGTRDGMHHGLMENKYDLFLQPGSSLAGALSSQTKASCLQSSSTTNLPAWFDQTNYATGPHSCKKTITDGKLTRRDSRVPSKSKSWRRCSAHAYICRLIEVLKITERRDGLPEKPIHASKSEALNLGHFGSDDDQLSARLGSNCVASFNSMTYSAAEKNSAEVQNAVPLHKRLPEDQQHGSTTSGLQTSNKWGSDFLSLATGGCDMDSSDRINRTGHSHEALKQFHVPQMQSQKQSGMLFSLPHNGYSSTFAVHPSIAAAQQIQLPPIISSTLSGSSHVDAIVPGEKRLESDEQQKWMAHIVAQYHPGFINHLPDWQNGRQDSSSLPNYAQALFPPFHSSSDSKYKPIAPQQQQQIITSNSSAPPSNVRRNYHHLPSGFERNGAAFHHPQSLQQLQLLCNQHL